MNYNVVIVGDYNMKKARLLSIALLSLILCALFINKDRLASFAQDYNILSIQEGMIIKNGTSFLFEDYVETAFGPSRCVNVHYHKENWDYIDNSEICTTPGVTDTQVVIENDYSDYWIVNEIYTESMGYEIYLLPAEYEKPEFYLECTPDKITMDTYATCTVTAEASFIMKDVEFDLDIDDFVIYDEVELGDVDSLTKNNNHYKLEIAYVNLQSTISGEGINFPFENPITIELMEFKVKTEKDQEVAVLGNVKLTELEYTDNSGKNPYEDLSSTVGQDSSTDVNSNNQGNDPEDGEAQGDKENPKTTDIIIGATVLFVIAFAVLITLGIKNKKIS